MTYKISPLRDNLPFGSIVEGFNTEMLGDPQVGTDLYNLWIDRGLVVFRGVPGGEAEHIRLSKVFGEPEIHPLKGPGYDPAPEMADISYDSSLGDLYEFEDGTQKGAWLPWHFDLVYVEHINHGGILRPLQLPSKGGQTGFIDQISAYDRLPADLCDTIEDLRVIYQFDVDASHMRFGRPAGLRLLRIHPRGASVMERIDQYPPVTHPMVYQQPGTGRKVLNFSPWFAVGIEGMDDDDSRDILEQITRYALDESGAYYHDWRMGDMVLWDNWRMMHCACGISPDDKRHMQRTTIAGDYGRGRLAAGYASVTRDHAVIEV